MPNTFTAGQKAMIETSLRLRLGELERRLDTRQEGVSRVEHAHEVLEQDGDDAPQRSVDREVDLALTDSDLAEVGQISSALQRLHTAEFGFCRQCGEQIPFDRLKLEPQALHCVSCEEAIERAAGGATRSRKL
jgi:DnaK suppressor protein